MAILGPGPPVGRSSPFPRHRSSTPVQATALTAPEPAPGSFSGQPQAAARHEQTSRNRCYLEADTNIWNLHKSLLKFDLSITLNYLRYVRNLCINSAQR